jgi:hypothetical protein
MVIESLPPLVNILLTIPETMYIVPARCGCRSAALTGGFYEEAATGSRFLGLALRQRLGRLRHQRLNQARTPAFAEGFSTSTMRAVSGGAWGFSALLLFEPAAMPVEQGLGVARRLAFSFENQR